MESIVKAALPDILLDIETPREIIVLIVSQYEKLEQTFITIKKKKEHLVRIRNNLQEGIFPNSLKLKHALSVPKNVEDSKELFLKEFADNIQEYQKKQTNL